VRKILYVIQGRNDAVSRKANDTAAAASRMAAAVVRRLRSDGDSFAGDMAAGG